VEGEKKNSPCSLGDLFHSQVKQADAFPAFHSSSKERKKNDVWEGLARKKNLVWSMFKAEI